MRCCYSMVSKKHVLVHVDLNHLVSDDVSTRVWESFTSCFSKRRSPDIWNFSHWQFTTVLAWCHASNVWLNLGWDMEPAPKPLLTGDHGFISLYIRKPHLNLKIHLHPALDISRDCSGAWIHQAFSSCLKFVIATGWGLSAFGESDTQCVLFHDLKVQR